MAGPPHQGFVTACPCFESPLRTHPLGTGGGAIFPSTLPACGRAQQRGAWDLGGGNLPQSQVVSVATGVAGSSLKEGQGSGVKGKHNMWNVRRAVAGKEKGQALPGPLTAPVFLVKGSSSCIGKIEANMYPGADSDFEGQFRFT